MPQETNLNVSPYFDDFDATKNYYKVLFKPGYPVQARELTTLQSILQNQTEQIGNHLFKEGQKVIPGAVTYLPIITGITLESEFSGVPVSLYLDELQGKLLKGQQSGVTARVVYVLKDSDSEIGLNTLYLNYIGADTNVNIGQQFIAGENLFCDEDINFGNSILPSGESILKCSTNSPNIAGTGFSIDNGVYFIRGTFVNVQKETILLDQYSLNPTYKIGFDVIEEVINSDIDPSLNDNANGFSNYAAPGADRFKISVSLTKKSPDDLDFSSFIQIAEVRSGTLISIQRNTLYNEIANEFARRTYDESGDYYVSPFSLEILESLNNGKGNNGLYYQDQITSSGTIPSDENITYSISPGKAYVRGFEVETISNTLIEIDKPRSTKTLENQSVVYTTGQSFSLNNVNGTPSIGINTSYTLSLRDSRLGSDVFAQSGKEIGLSRVYDFALESGSYDTLTPKANQWDISLYDIQFFTEITLNEPITINASTHVRGKSSGAIGFVKNSVTNSGIVTVYGVDGRFVRGETFEFNGIQNNRISTVIKNYGINDVQSIYGIVGSASTFTADVRQNSRNIIGIASITAASAGVSTVLTSSVLSGIASVGNLVSYTKPGDNLPSFGEITSVSLNNLVISGVTTVPGVCEGSLPLSGLSVSDLSVIYPSYKVSRDNFLYTKLPKNNVSNVDLTNSQITIRKQFDVSIVANTISGITADANETFLPFDEERYALTLDDGTIEPLSSDQFEFISGGSQLTINGISSTSGTGRLIATLRKVNVTNKSKLKNSIRSIIVDKSKLEGSGIGSTTLNNGLTYGNYPYGTRVEDKEICLLTCDAQEIYGIFESSNTSDPVLPRIEFYSLNGSTNSTDDLLIGEQFIGLQSRSIGVIVEKFDSRSVNYISLNGRTFIPDEELSFYDSKLSGRVSELYFGDRNIKNNFIFDNGQKETYYDYSKIVRKETLKEPSKKLRIVFSSASYSNSDVGDITTKNSYNSFDYSKIQSNNGIRNSDILDIRPRVSDYSVSEGSTSPFEFLSRSFSSNGSSKYILASDEDINLAYSFYLPRIDKIFLSPFAGANANFQLSKGEPAESPRPPAEISNSIEVAQINLPAYLYSPKDVTIRLAKHPRYRMKDIAKLERRIENLEYYTTLSLLETTTSSLFIDDGTGRNRFKSGFFVDNFTDTITQTKETVVKNSVDIKNQQLRPSHFTTSVDLKVGITTTLTSYQNTRFVDNSNLDGVGIKKSKNIITLDYEDLVYIEQPYATRTENVTALLLSYYLGVIELFPESDTWVDQTRLAAKTIEVEGNYTETAKQLEEQGLDSQTGYSQTIWSGWTTTWTGEEITGRETVEQQASTAKVVAETETYVETGTQARSGVSISISERFDNFSKGDVVVSSSIIPYMRSRNIEFTARKLKPNSLVSAFFDSRNVNEYIVPKLIEIEMVSGTFETGEIVESIVDNYFPSNSNTGVTPFIKFRCAQPNHRYGILNDPTDIFIENPYESGQELQTEYSSNSTILNVDTLSLADITDSDFYGYINIGMTLIGKDSGAIARVINSRLVTDNVGTVIGSFHIPDPNIPDNPQFESGAKIFRLTNDIFTFAPGGAGTTDASATFYSQGKIEEVQEEIVSVRNAQFNFATESEEQSITSDEKTRVVAITAVSTVGGTSGGGGSSGGGGGGRGLDLPSSIGVGAIDYLVESYPNFTYAEIANAIVSAYGNGQVSVGAAAAYWIGTVLGGDYSYLAGGKQATSDQRSRASLIDRNGFTPGGQRVQGAADPNLSNVTEGARNEVLDTSDVGNFPTNQQLLNFGSTFTKCSNQSDPLAQSFYVQEPSGIFITKLDLYFASKDPSLPVIIQIRPMSLGLPTTTIYPFSTVVLYPDQITTSDDGSVATTVTFDSPVYLEGTKEHAIVLLSDSLEYTVWISRLGEIDRSTINLPESQQIVVTEQPLLGSLFKSQNGSTWDPSQYEDLKFILYKAAFVDSGEINFYNPSLNIGNNQVAKLLPDSIEMDSRKIRVGLGTTLTSTDLNIGNTVLLQGTNSTANYIGAAGIATGPLTIVNSGIGYTPSSGSFTFNNVPLTTITGNGKNATADITILDGAIVASGATIRNGGTGYVVGDVLGIGTIGTLALGRNARLSVGVLTAFNEIILDQVQGDFVAGIGNTIQYINSSGITTNLNGGNVSVNSVDVETLGDHIRVYHKNHGMYSSTNLVTISNVLSDVKPVRLSQDLDTTSTGDIAVTDSSEFGTFENVGVGTTNYGYLLIGNEIISYSSTGNNVIGITTRAVNSTQASSYSSGTLVFKYELNGVSLNRINKTHSLANVDNSIVDPIDLDYYTVKIDMSGASPSASDRSSVVGLPKLYFNQTKSDGGSNINSTQNIPFEIMTPNIQVLSLTGTSVFASVNTLTGTSIDGNEVSFERSGFVDMPLDKKLYFDSPRIIASNINEQTFVNDEKSLNVKMNMRTFDANISPVLDTERVNLILTSNRVNSAITNYVEDYRVNTIKEDPSKFVYVTKRISLENSASSLKVILAAHVNIYNDIRVFYSISNNQNDSLIYTPFPGYTNLDINGNVIDSSDSDGLPDTLISKTDVLAFENDVVFNDYTFTADNLPSFKYYSIKVVMTSTNQAFPPRLKDFRAIALA